MHDAPTPAATLGIRGSACADAAAAEIALDLAAPLLEGAARNPAINQSGVVYVVLMDPVLTPAVATFEQAILAECSYGLDRSRWDADYAGFARAKARLSWETGLDGHLVQALQPQRLKSGDTALWGSVALDGIVVAVSGCEAAWDEALSGTVAMLLRAQAKTAAARLAGQTQVA